MIEEMWRSGNNPEEMLRNLGVPLSERKLRLFTLACCRRIDRFIVDPRSQAALSFVETHVETTPNRKKGRQQIEKAALAAHREAYARLFGPGESTRSAGLIASNAADAAHSALDRDPSHAARYAPAFAVHAVAWDAANACVTSAGSGGYSQDLRLVEQSAQADLLREVVGNPFRPCDVKPAWVRWHDGTVANLAQSIYSEVAYDRLGILADALEDAGCTDDDILKHLRSDGPHLRGCWAVDRLLGKS